MKIRHLTVQPPLALAPMVGLSHSALRSLVVRLGGVGLLYTEMLSAKRLPQENEKVSPCLIRSSEEKPLFYQLFLSSSEHVAAAVDKLHRLGADGIDLNLGCPAPQVQRRGAGCALAEDHHAVTRVLKCLRRRTELPISVKVRLGKAGEEGKFLDLCRLVEAEGCDCLIVHARYNREKFCRKPRWQWVEKAKAFTTVPVLANGGIFSVDDARRCLQRTGADGLMIGRGAVEKPWLFREIAGELYGLPGDSSKKTELAQTYLHFAALLEDRLPGERRLGRLKKFTHYYARSYMFGHQLAFSVQKSESFAEAKECAAAFFAANEQLSIGGKYV